MRRLGAIVVAAFICVGTLAAQSGQVSGTVRGENGHALPGVTVKLESPALEKALLTTTSEKGTYAFAGVPADDRYVVTFSLVCFRTDTQRKLTIAQDQRSTVDAEMRVGDCTGDAPVPAFRGGIVPIPQK